MDIRLWQAPSFFLVFPSGCVYNIIYKRGSKKIMMSDSDKSRLQSQYDTPENARSENYGLTRKQIRFAEEYIAPTMPLMLS